VAAMVTSRRRQRSRAWRPRMPPSRVGVIKSRTNPARKKQPRLKRDPPNARRRRSFVRSFVRFVERTDWFAFFLSYSNAGRPRTFPPKEGTRGDDALVEIIGCSRARRLDRCFENNRRICCPPRGLLRQKDVRRFRITSNIDRARVPALATFKDFRSRILTIPEIPSFIGYVNNNDNNAALSDSRCINIKPAKAVECNLDSSTSCRITSTRIDNRPSCRCGQLTR